MVNNFNEYILLALKANHDIQPLFCSLFESMSALFYMTNYCTKKGPSSHSMLSLMSSSVRSLEAQTRGLTDEDRVRRLIHRCYNTASNATEFSAAQIATMALNLGTDGTHYTSERFTKLYTNQFYQYVYGKERNKEDEDIIPVNPKDISVTAPTDCQEEADMEEIEDADEEDIKCPQAVSNYIHRGSPIEEMCLYEHAMFMYDRRFKKQFVDQECGGEDSRKTRDCFLKVLYEKSHPNYDTHVAAMRGDPLTVILSGKSIPHSETDRREQYVQQIMTLFKPWRSPNDLKRVDQSWVEAFEDWIIEPRILAYIQNIDALRQSEEDRKQAIAERFDIAAEVLPAETDYQNVQTIMDETIDDDPDEDLIPLRLRRTLETHDAHTIKVLQSAGSLGFFQIGGDGTPLGSGDDSYEQSTSFQIRGPLPPSVTAKDYQQQLKNQVNQSRSVEIEGDFFSQLDSESRPINSAYILQESFGSHEAEAQLFSADWKLNAEQDQFFMLVIKYVIEMEIFMIQESEPPTQLRLAVLGPGGTGKSHVINSILAFLQRYQLQQKVLLGAYTGSAANGINGHTLHSLLGFGIMDKDMSEISENDRTKVSQLKKKWKDIHLLIIDEVSMIGCNFMQKINAELCRVRDSAETDKPFGGLGICFTGDFMQLKPVADTSLLHSSIVEDGLVSKDLTSLSKEDYNLLTATKKRAIDKLKEEKTRLKAYNQHHGRMLWKSVDKVIFLHQSKRQEGDPFWAAILTRLRQGALSDNDIQILRSKVMSRSLESSDHGPIIVLRNSLRHALNTRAIFKFAAQRNQQVFAIQSHDVIPGIIPDHLDVKKRIGSEHLFEGLPHILYLTKDAPVVITKNQHVPLGVTNGAAAKVASICLSARDKTEAAAQYIIDPLKPYFLKDFPEYVTLDMRNEQGEVRHEPLHGLSDWELPIMPGSESVVVKGVSPNGTEQQKTFRRTSFYLTLGFALTDYKVQGKSYDAAIVDLSKPARSKSGINSLYVMLSRIRSLEGLRILTSFDEHDLRVQLPPNYRKEMHRLEQLSCPL